MNDHGLERLVWQCFYIGIGILVLWWIIVALFPVLVAGGIGWLLLRWYVDKDEPPQLPK